MTAERIARESRQTVLTLLLVEREQIHELETASKESPVSKRGNRPKWPSISVRPRNSREADSSHP
jgi:hypothetical protein